MSHSGHRRKGDKFNMTRKQGGHASPVSSVSARHNGSRESVIDNRTDGRIARENFKKERKLESYLADDANFPEFSNQLEKMGLQLRDIPGDGNCLFRALGDQLEGHCRNHFKHRQDVVRYMAEHRKDFEPFTEDEIPFEVHLQNLKKLGVYAGNDAIVAFARLHQVNIVIHQLNTKNLMITGSQNVSSRQLHISYHNGDHYSSVRKQNDNTESPACIKLSDESKGTETFGKVTFNPAMADGCVRARRGFEAIEDEVMTATSCQDRDMVRKTLSDYDFDAEAAIVHLMQIMELTGGQEFGAYSDDSRSLAADSGTWSPNGARAWSQGSQASGRRTNKDERGHMREDSCGESSGYGSLRSNSEGVHVLYSGVPQQNAYHGLTSRKKKEKKKAEKKSRARERHRQQFQPVVVAASPPQGPVFSVLSSSITRI